jgi:hypothetical protein
MTNVISGRDLCKLIANAFACTLINVDFSLKILFILSGK